MSLASLLTHAVAVSRLVDGAGITRAYEQVSASVPCLVQPLDAESSQQAGMSFGSAFRVWFLPDADIQVGDRLEDQQSRNYTVRGVNLRDYGINQHLDVLVEQDAGA